MFTSKHRMNIIRNDFFFDFSNLMWKMFGKYRSDIIQNDSADLKIGENMRVTSFFNDLFYSKSGDF